MSETRTAMEAEDSRWTYEDYARLPDDGKRYEVIDGRLYVSPAPRPRHQIVSITLADALLAYLRADPRGLLLTAPIDVVLTSGDVVQPDLVYIARERAKIIGEKNIQGPPDLVIEILSEGYRERDEILKRKRYPELGVGEYWVVDPPLKTVKVYRAASGGYERATELTAETGATLTTPVLPGFEAALSAIFADPLQGR